MRSTSPQPTPSSTAAEVRVFLCGMAVILVVAGFVWGAYLFAQPSADPHFDAPAFDAAYYLDWSDAVRGVSSDDTRFEGAFYRAPLYPYLLAALRSLGMGLFALYALQLVLALGTTAWLGLNVYRWAGRTAGWAVTILLCGYHPWLFFSARLLSESWAIALIAVALTLVVRTPPRAAWGAGLCAGLATLARPNLLLVALGWVAWALWTGDRGKALRLIVGVALLVLPVTLVNGVASGHLVPVSSNGGLTLYHGNGPGALGVYTPPQGMSGEIKRQRHEATALASQLAGRSLDAVEADRYWGRQAVATRLAAPFQSLTLIWNRLLLTLSTHEIALDEAPALDPNPWRRPLAIPFAALLGLAAASVGALRRWQAAPWVWIALLACAATPLLFYVSARYRLPLAVLLALPAAIGVREIVALRVRALGVAALVGLISLTAPWVATLSMPYRELARAERSAGLCAQARSYHDRGLATQDLTRRQHDWALAQERMERARSIGGESATWLFTQAGIVAAEGRSAEAQELWQRSWNQHGSAVGTRVAAAASLAAGWLEAGRAEEALQLMREALQLIPLHEICRNNLIVALVATGRAEQARAAVAEAQRLGVPLNPELVALVLAAESRR